VRRRHDTANNLTEVDHDASARADRQAGSRGQTDRRGRAISKEATGSRMERTYDTSTRTSYTV
jgi:hypothetical protein